MKRHIFFLLAITFIAFTYSCSDTEAPIGKWDDNIKLSSKSALFEAGTDSTIITTQGDWWWIDGISVNDKYYQFGNNDGIDLLSDHYTLKDDCFFVQRRDKNTIFIKLFENTNQNKRYVNIYLEAGDYFDYINITQKGKTGN